MAEGKRGAAGYFAGFSSHPRPPGTGLLRLPGLCHEALAPERIRRTPASAGFLLIRACARRLQHPSRSLQCAR